MSHSEELAISKLPLVTNELARKAAKAIVGQLGKLQDAAPKFNFGLHQPNDASLATVIATNSICDPMPGQGVVGNAQVSIDVDPQGKFTVHLGGDKTYMGDGNNADEVARIPQSIVSAQHHWAVAING